MHTQLNDSEERIRQRDRVAQEKKNETNAKESLENILRTPSLRIVSNANCD